MAVYRPKYRDPKTGELVESRVYWYEFTFAGKRHRDSTKQTLKTLAAEVEKDERRKLERAYAGLPTESRAQRIRTVSGALKDYYILKVWVYDRTFRGGSQHTVYGYGDWPVKICNDLQP